MDLNETRAELLDRQGLIRGFSDPFEAVRAMVAVQTQYAASLPVSVATRLRIGEPGWEEEHLEPGGGLIKSWSVRHTLHAHLAQDHALILGTIGDRAYRRYVGWMTRHRGIDVSSLESKIENALQDGPLDRRTLHERVPELKEIPGTGWGLDVMGLALRRRVCMVGRGATQRFALLEAEPVSPDLPEMFRRYLEGFGPATLHDFAHWTGLPLGEVRHLADAEGVERLEVPGWRGTRYRVPCLSESNQKIPAIRMLAKFDTLTLAHRDKTIWLPSDHHSRVFRKAAQVEAVVLSRGIACATWRMSHKGKSLAFQFEPFRPLTKHERSGIEREAARLAKNLGKKGLEILEFRSFG